MLSFKKIILLGFGLFSVLGLAFFIKVNWVHYHALWYQKQIMDDDFERFNTILHDGSVKSFAGLYFLNEPPYGVWIAYKGLSDNSPQSIFDDRNFNALVENLTKETKWKDFIHTKKVKYSLKELEEVQEKTIVKLRNLGVAAGGGIDVVNNKIDIHVTRISDVEKLILARQIKLHESIHIEQVIDLY